MILIDTYIRGKYDMSYDINDNPAMKVCVYNIETDQTVKVLYCLTLQSLDLLEYNNY